MPVIAPPASPHPDFTHRHTTGGLSTSAVANNNNDMVDLRSPSPGPSASGSQPLRTSRPPASAGSSQNGSSSARVPSPTRPALPSAASRTPAADFLRALGGGGGQRSASQASQRSPSAKGSRSPTRAGPASPSQASSSRSQATQRTPSPTKSPVRSEAQLIPLGEASPSSPRQRISLAFGSSSVAHMRKVDGASTSPDTKGKGRQLTLANWLEPISEDGGVWRTPPRKANRPVVELPSPTPRRVQPPEPLKIGPVNRAFVVLKIKASRRDELIAKGWYDRFRDDDDTPHQYHQKRGLHAAAAFGSSVMLRPAKGRLHGEIPRQARVREPEDLPERFVHRPGPGILEPWASVVNEESLLNRVNEYPCGWKGCDALLASEALLKKHVAFRAHAAQGAFIAGLYGEHTVYRCHWRGCTGPCFDEIWKLVQHMDAVHIGPKLLCPYEGCGLRSPSLHHLQRHVMKQHDLPDDYPHPLANAAVLEEVNDDDLAPLPDTAYTHELTTQPIAGSWFKEPKQELLRKKVHDKCYAPDDPDIFHNHPPLMLDGELESDSALPTAEGTEVASEFSVDVDPARPAKRRRLVPVVEIVRKSPGFLRKYARMPEMMPLPPKEEPTELELVPPITVTDAEISFSAAESDIESELFAELFADVPDEPLDSSTFE